MVSSVFSLLNYELPDTFIASTPQFWNYVQAPSWFDQAGDGLYADFGVNVVHGIVWFWLLEQWRAVPKELWAWKCVTIWTVGHYYNGCSIWVPSVRTLSLPASPSSTQTINVKAASIRLLGIQRRPGPVLGFAGDDVCHRPTPCVVNNIGQYCLQAV